MDIGHPRCIERSQQIEYPPIDVFVGVDVGVCTTSPVGGFLEKQRVDLFANPHTNKFATARNQAGQVGDRFLTISRNAIAKVKDVRVFQFVFTHDFGGGVEAGAQIGGAQNMLWAVIENRFDIDRPNVGWFEGDIASDCVDVDQEHGIFIVGLGDQSVEYVTLGLNVDIGSRCRHVIEDNPLTWLRLIDAG